MPPRRRDGLVVLAAAFAARVAVVAWALHRFPPAADGTYYHRIAERIAQGLGYTWLWPDGAVTYAAHYPVGYPALVGAAYALAGARPASAMVLDAIVGSLAALAAHALASRAVDPSSRHPRAAPLAAGLLVALHPGLVMYTPALMTEGVTAALIACGAALAALARERTPRGAIGALVAVGVVMGIATLVRPQCLVLAPIFGALAVLRHDGEAIDAPVAWRRVAVAAITVTLTTLLVVAPWTARNCVRMKRCALVSVNGGWNLLIGADAASTGAWSPIKVPDACREVFDEAEKDECFGREARRFVREHPAEWLALAPRKLAATFDYAGAAPWYLHEANPEAFPWRAKEVLGGVETVYERVLLLLALVWAARGGARGGGATRIATIAVALVGIAFTFTLHAWIGYLALGAALLLGGRRVAVGPVLPFATAAVVLATAATHAVFFGAGRYSLVVFPLVTALAPLAVHRRATT